MQINKLHSYTIEAMGLTPIRAIHEPGRQPWVGDVLLAPADVYQQIRAFHSAHRTGNHEELLDRTIRISQAPMALAAASMALMRIIALLDTTLLPSYLNAQLGRYFGFFGLALSMGELAYESLWIGREVTLLTRLNRRKCARCKTPEEKLALYIQDLEFFKSKYLTLSQIEVEQIELQVVSAISDESQVQSRDMYRFQLARQVLYVKRKQLANRIGVRQTNALETSIFQILRDLKTEETGQKRQNILYHTAFEAEKLLNDIDIHVRKKIIVHLVGFAAAALTIVALVGITGFFAPIVAIVVLYVGGIIGTLRYFMSKGLLESEGWSWNADAATPGWVKAIHNRFFKQKAIPCEPKTTEITLIEREGGYIDVMNNPPISTLEKSDFVLLERSRNASKAVQ